MGLNCSSDEGSLTLGTRAMKDALHPFGNDPIAWKKVHNFHNIGFYDVPVVNNEIEVQNCPDPDSLPLRTATWLPSLLPQRNKLSYSY